ncbi:CNP1-like family protein [Andreprevotia lacus DSM 23236]|jgi:hypothetical protein|uniref:CNP1-like family protein n=1 Tax=Andreprevotia lacus DSM 23236 TaxID=1121001 RepID=A0A1W1XBS8_9NEIS|nr:CNP1-like family protein [Andreprevotia lacus]SMC20961.1 CNP1-like family protein [Andreprevotia lacus DSM 23236]
MKTSKLAVLLTLALSLAAQAGEMGTRPQGKDSGDSGSLLGKIWEPDKPRPAPEEQPFDVPALSSLQNWKTFKADYVSRETRFEIATDSLTVGEQDNIVRFAVAITPKGSQLRNVRFEGIDCETQQYRVYQYGSADGSWQKSSQPWKVITKNTLNVFEGALYEEVCGLSGPNKLEQSIANLGGKPTDRLRGSSNPK